MLRRRLSAGATTSTAAGPQPSTIAAIERDLGGIINDDPFVATYRDHSRTQLSVRKVKDCGLSGEVDLRLRGGRTDVDHRLPLQQIYARPATPTSTISTSFTAPATAARSTASRPSRRNSGFRVMRGTTGSTGWSAAITRTRSSRSMTTSLTAPTMPATATAWSRPISSPAVLRPACSRRGRRRPALTPPLPPVSGHRFHQLPGNGASQCDGGRNIAANIGAIGAFARLPQPPAFRYPLPELQPSTIRQQRLCQSQRAWRPSIVNSTQMASRSTILSPDEQQLGALHAQHLLDHRPAEADARRTLHA